MKYQLFCFPVVFCFGGLASIQNASSLILSWYEVSIILLSRGVLLRRTGIDTERK